MSGPAIRSLPTTYDGVTFRSRLEARWAVFFDALGIEWVYEAEGFELSTGEWYLPDFWLPTFGGGMFVEVKPIGGDFSKARQLGADLGKAVWFAAGVPAVRVYTYNEPGHGDSVGIPNADRAEGEDRMYGEPGYEDATGAIPTDSHRSVGPSYLDAVRKARRWQFVVGRP